MEKGEYRPSNLQRSIWDAWLEYWQLVADYKERLQAKVYALCLGDLGDLNKHSDAELVSKVDADVERAMLDVTKPIEHIIDLWFIVRGTEAHSKSAGLLEEWFASDRTNAVHCSSGTASWEAWEGKIEGVHIYAAHHLPSGTKIAGNRGNAVANSCRYLSM